MILEKASDAYDGLTYPPAETLLIGDYQQRVRDAPNNAICEEKITQLTQALIARNPHIPAPLSLVDQGPSDIVNSLTWFFHILPKHYPAVTLCHANEKIAALKTWLQQNKIKRARINQSFFVYGEDSLGHVFNTQFDKAQTQDDKALLQSAFRASTGALGVLQLVTLTQADYAPAQLELARLSNVGQLIRLTPAYNAYILARAKRNGHADPALDDMLERARKAVPEAERGVVADRIERGAWPESAPIALD